MDVKYVSPQPLPYLEQATTATTEFTTWKLVCIILYLHFVGQQQ